MTRKYQVIYYLGDETCAGQYTEDELAKLMTNAQVTNSLTFIGQDADMWEDAEFRTRLCEKALALLPKEA